MVHILNGDALLERFPKSIGGAKIVTRECLVEGPVSGYSMEKLFANRATFFETNYAVTREEYADNTIREFDRMRSIPENQSVYLWFEDDLFCQVNAWFVAAVLDALPHAVKVYWVSPIGSNLEFGFGGLERGGLKRSFQEAARLSAVELSNLATLWPAFQNKDFASLLQLALSLHAKLPMLPTAVAAHIERFPLDGSLGRPEKTLLSIKEELGTDDFNTIFREFRKREAIYGFGDVQVKRLLSDIS
ncbi:MAG: DUF1835 domain-containing protein [Saprospiraceae bacterium]|nr:DUF1835 domain-containing protein [Saprospiraceae bacterium]